jgi:hypothetical protein
MKPYSLKKSVRIVRICVVAFILSVISLFLFSFTVSYKLGDDVWKQLGLSEAQGQEKIKTSFLYNYLDYYGVRNFKNLAAGNRGAVAKDLLQFTKQYVSSNVFKIEYQQYREASKPIEPSKTVRSKEDIRKEKIAETEKSIKNMEESMKTMSTDMQKIMQSGIDMQKNMLKEYKDPDSQMIELFYQGEVMNRQSDLNRYKEDMEKWEMNYPADHKQLVKARLQKYLSLAATVDFNAELYEKNGKKYFVKHEYEIKNHEWKMIYRAGKEVYDVTKAFAENWLKEL